MKINDKELNVDDLIVDLNVQDDFLIDRGNGIYLSNNQINILNYNSIDYKKYSSLSSLIFEIEQLVNDEEDFSTDLEELLKNLAEINYYKNTKK